MKTRKKIVAVVVFGRLWTKKANGRTYHDVSWTVVYHDGSRVDGQVGATYGYGDYYLESAFDSMVEYGALKPREQNKNGSKEELWQRCQALGAAFVYDRCKVTRKEL